LSFCLFKAAASTMSGFPALGIDYGVFAASDFSKAMQTGWVYTDDEDRDSGNRNLFTGDSDGQRIITPTGSLGRNTTLNTAKVGCTTPDCGYCGNYICSPYENAASCPFDCGVCGDSICGANEDTWNCSTDCSFVCGDGICSYDEGCYDDCSGYCGDGYCGSNEDYWSCEQDC
jgi:hypothetical protein